MQPQMGAMEAHPMLIKMFYGSKAVALQMGHAWLPPFRVLKNSLKSC